jgi:hypothetical protein
MNYRPVSSFELLDRPCAVSSELCPIALKAHPAKFVPWLADSRSQRARSFYARLSIVLPVFCLLIASIPARAEEPQSLGAIGVPDDDGIRVFVGAINCTALTNLACCANPPAE